MARKRRRTKRRSALLEGFEREGRIQALRTVMFHNAVSACAGLNVTDFNCINLLSMEGPLTTGEIAQRTGLTRGGAVTTMIDRLEAAGYVRRERDTADRRRVIVQLVPEKVFPSIVPLFDGFNAAWGEFLEEYDDEQLELLLRYLARTNELLHRVTLELQQSS